MEKRSIYVSKQDLYVGDMSTHIHVSKQDLYVRDMCVDQMRQKDASGTLALFTACVTFLMCHMTQNSVGHDLCIRGA